MKLWTTRGECTGPTTTWNLLQQHYSSMRRGLPDVIRIDPVVARDREPVLPSFVTQLYITI